MRSPGLPPFDFLLESSSFSLQELELNSLALAANLGKGIKEEMFMWAEQYAAAMLARWMMENREKLLRWARQEVPIDPLEVLNEIRGRKSA